MSSAPDHLTINNKNELRIIMCNIGKESKIINLNKEDIKKHDLFANRVQASCLRDVFDRKNRVKQTQKETIQKTRYRPKKRELQTTLTVSSEIYNVLCVYLNEIKQKLITSFSDIANKISQQDQTINIDSIKQNLVVNSKSNIIQLVDSLSLRERYILLGIATHLQFRGLILLVLSDLQHNKNCRICVHLNNILTMLPFLSIMPFPRHTSLDVLG